jgi:3-oxoacyl-[acyl-carrier protein] reductase
MWELFDKNTIALVTGASRGIGKAIAEELASQGVTVIVNYAANASAADDVVRNILNNGGSAESVQADVSDFESVVKMFKEIKTKYGKLDILVNNAGVTNDGFAASMSAAKFSSVINTNLIGCFHVTKNALLLMCSKKQNGGNIVNITSTSGISGQIGQCNYSASKGGIIAFTKAIAAEYADKGIRCNAVAPGFVATDMTAKLPETMLEKYKELIPLKRFGQPEEIANIVAFLASKKSYYITRKVIIADGGLING